MATAEESFAMFQTATAQATAKFNGAIAEPAHAYVQALEALVTAERRFLTDASNDVLAGRSKAARDAYDQARTDLDKARTAALGVRTKALNDAWTDATK